MAQQHLNSVLNSVGLEQADIDTILGIKDDATDFKPDVAVGKITAGIETKVKNDPKFWESLDEKNVNEGFKKKIENQQYGRAAGIAKGKVLKALGITEEDLSDLTDDEKAKYETVITKAAEKFVSSKSTAPAVQKELIEARKKLEALEAEIPVKEGKLKEQYEAQWNNEKLDYIILSELGTIDNLKVPAQYLLQKLSSELKEENAFVVSGTKASPKQKANPSLDVLEGSKVLTLKDLITKKLKADGLLTDPADNKDKKQSGKATADVTPNGSGGLAISSHIMEQIKANTKTAS